MQDSYGGTGNEETVHTYWKTPVLSPNYNQILQTEFKPSTPI